MDAERPIRQLFYSSSQEMKAAWVSRVAKGIERHRFRICFAGRMQNKDGGCEQLGNVKGVETIVEKAISGLKVLKMAILQERQRQ